MPLPPEAPDRTSDASTDRPGTAQVTRPPKVSATPVRWIIAAAGLFALAWMFYPALSGGRSESARADRSDETASATGGAADGGPSCSAEAAPAKLDFTLTDMNGKPVNLADYKGRPVLINFWATWCGPCKLEIPSFVELQEKYRDTGFIVLGVSIDDPPEALRSFAKEYRMNYPVLQITPEFDQAYGPIWAVPTSFFIRRNGTICKKQMGPASKEDFEKDIRALL